MIDSDWSVVIGGEAAAGLSVSPVVPDARGERQDSLADACPDAVWGAPPWRSGRGIHGKQPSPRHPQEATLGTAVEEHLGHSVRDQLHVTDPWLASRPGTLGKEASAV
jgi:hypothetical protein